MVIFNKTLGDYFSKYRWSSNRELGEINEEELNKIVQIMKRVSTDYSCSTAEGFTYEENEFARLLEFFYSEAFKKGMKYGQRKILEDTQNDES